MILVYGTRKRNHCFVLIVIFLVFQLFILGFVDWSVVSTWINTSNTSNIVPDTFITTKTSEPLQSPELRPYSNETSTLLSDVYDNTYVTTQTTSIDDTNIRNDDIRPTDDILATSSCIWVTNEFQNCLDILVNHISLSLNKTRVEFLQSQEIKTESLAYDNNLQNYFRNQSTIVHRRWLFMGDSTIFRLFLLTPIHNFLMKDSLNMYQQYRQSIQCPNSAMNDQLSCTEIYCSRCDTMEKLNLQRLTSNTEWKQPNFLDGEGPLKFGLENPYCTDCDGCDTRFVSCAIQIPIVNQDMLNDTSTATECILDPNTQRQQYIGPSYGGYFSIEFARDVELQTLEYNTTQENIISSYIANHWNAPLELQVTEFGYPICVVGTGHHDIAVPNITLDVYVQNVHWYVHILSQQCDYIIWISNNCPLTDEFAQTKNDTLEWNLAVRDLLLSSNMEERIRSKVFFLDVYNASATYEHMDNIHMSNGWYELLASFLQKVMTNLTL